MTVQDPYEIVTSLSPSAAAEWGRIWTEVSGCYAVTLRGESPIPLRTGRRHPGESRAAHARRVRLARIRRRRARRLGVPAATVQRQSYWPSVVVEVEGP